MMIIMFFLVLFFNNPNLLQSLRTDALKNNYEEEFLNKKSMLLQAKYLQYH